MSNAFTALAVLPALLTFAVAALAVLASYRGDADVRAAILRSNAPKAASWSTRDAATLRALRMALPLPAKRVASFTRRTGLLEAATVADRRPVPTEALPTVNDRNPNRKAA